MNAVSREHGLTQVGRASCTWCRLLHTVELDCHVGQNSEKPLKHRMEQRSSLFLKLTFSLAGEVTLIPENLI